MKQVTLYGAHKENSRLEFPKPCLCGTKLKTFVFHRPLITACYCKRFRVSFSHHSFHGNLSSLRTKPGLRLSHKFNFFVLLISRIFIIDHGCITHLFEFPNKKVFVKEYGFLL